MRKRSEGEKGLAKDINLRLDKSSMNCGIHNEREMNT